MGPRRAARLFEAPQLRVFASHAVRAGEGLDAVRVVATGFGVLVGLGRWRIVRGGFDGLVLRRFPGGVVRAWMLGPGGLAQVTVALAPATAIGTTSVPMLVPALPPARVPTMPDLLTAVPDVFVPVDVRVLVPSDFSNRKDLDGDGL